ncbi:MAG: Glycogen synthase [candidate division WWE3 bacterium GW2011_GWA2_46_9]|uniref:Glycogen synthase n=1 Tax=candidate division WWE3 bacterium GW2011_GWA2_46_9 TaxID=1619111 RepID=A0A0G1QUS1_UNCKA|nr:MAG: Glycogen synthase [candidate division WWE3 bacterium GW2011_GWA2_46_9]
MEHPLKKKNIINVLESLIAESHQPDQKLKILFVAVEASPYASVGGFASVVAFLTKELKKRGHDVRIFMPKFGFLDEEKYKTKMVCEGLKVPTDDEDKEFLVCNVKTTTVGDVQTYFLENQEYYELRANVYSYSDDPTRWALLSRGCLEFIKTGDFVPNIIHCHDWHTGIVANYLKTVYKKDPILRDIASVFTIHNLAIQGIQDMNNFSEMDFDDGKSPVASLFDPTLNKQNFMKRGIIYSDVVNTVSKTDTLIEKNYDSNSTDKRVYNKLTLQKEFDLPQDENVMLLGFVGRLDWQKGVDLMIKTLDYVLSDFDVQFVQVGGGDAGLADMLRGLQEKHPGKVGIHTHLNFTLSRLLFAGCDAILYPSRFEPCGIVQLEAMRYGAIPVVRDVGGLSDTVVGFNSTSGEGTGFVFKNFSEFALLGQIVRAIEIFKNKPLWKKVQRNAMKQDFSWSYSAREYERLYERTLSIQKV